MTKASLSHYAAGYVYSKGKGESETIVEDIQALNGEYLKNERCIILAIVPANVDFHNSRILADARKVDPSTRRIIPVITKPDLIDRGAEGSVLALLKGAKTDFFELGFHIVKCRGQQALDDKITIEKEVEQENAFFASKAPWKDYTIRDSMGTDSLRSKLALLQIDMLKAEVPKIRSELIRQRDAAMMEVTKLGKSFSTDIERRMEFQGIVGVILDSVEHNIKGSKDTGYTVKVKAAALKFRSYIIQLSTQLTADIMKTRLADMTVLRVGDRVIYHAGGEYGDLKGSIVAANDSSSVSVRLDVTVNSIAFLATQNYANTSTEKLLEMLAAKNSARLLAWEYGVNPADTSLVSVTDLTKLTLSDDWLEALIVSYRDDNLAVFPSIELMNQIVRDKVKSDWEPLSRAFATSALTELKRLLEWVLAQSVPAHYTKMAAALQHKMSQVVDTLFADCKTSVDKILEQESHPYTNNHYLFENLNKDRFKEMREKLKSMATADPNASNPLRKVDIVTIDALFDANENLTYTQYSTRELKMALSAYGKVAAKRLIDNVPMAVESALLKKVASHFEATTHLLDSEMRALFTEPKETAFKRGKYQDIIDDLNQALDAFQTCLEQ